jgi:hypothetical protein
MNRDLRLRLLKLLVNVPLRVVDLLLPEPPEEARFPQTQMVLSTYRKMLKTYRIECLQGTFGSSPDGNFERFLRVAVKVLARVSEDDRYYRAWVGLAFLLARSELEGLNFGPAQLKALCRTQWLFDVDFLPESYVVANRAEFVEMALCDYLGNLTRMDLPLETEPEIGGMKS